MVTKFHIKEQGKQNKLVYIYCAVVWIVVTDLQMLFVTWILNSFFENN